MTAIKYHVMPNNRSIGIDKIFFTPYYFVNDI